MQANQANLLAPAEVRDDKQLLPTGNEYVALPAVGADGSIDGCNVLHMGAKGLLEFLGSEEEPFVTPQVWLDGRPWPMGQLHGERVVHWLPRWTRRAGGLEVEGTVFAPVGYKGWVYVLRARNRGEQPVRVGLGLRVVWARARHTVCSSRPVQGQRVASYDPGTQTLGFEMRAGTGLVAMAMGASRPLGDLDRQLMPADGSAPSGHQVQVTNESDPAITATVKDNCDLASGEEAVMAFYFGVNAEPDGARAVTEDLQWRGWQSLLEETQGWLQARAVTVPDAGWNARLNLNLFFNCFFAAGRTVDTEEWVMVASRSSRYGAAAAFRARHAFLWSFPALLMVEPRWAREAILVGFTRYARNAGTHSLYLDGTVLFPGADLDELCAYLLALERYLHATEDWSILKEAGPDGAAIWRGINELEQHLEELKHPARGLYRTHRSPAGDPATHPYLTSSNVMVWKALRAIGPMKHQGGDSLGEWRVNQRAAQLAEVIRRQCVVDGPGGPMFAWALDEGRRAQLMDQPAGSLQLLAYYGFCEEDEAVFRRTLGWIHSDQNPHYCAGEYAGPGCWAAPDPWVLSACYDLLPGGNPERGLDFLNRAAMDNGIACQTVDRETGRVKTGAAFAGGAGLLAYAVYTALSR